jgi:hypothetical protein
MHRFVVGLGAGSVCNVPGFDRIKQRLCPEPQHWSIRVAGAAGFDLLHDFCSGLSSSQVQLGKQNGRQ